MKTLQDNVGALTRWSLEQRWDFVRRIAWDWFKERTFDWPLQEFSRRIAAELPDLPREEIEAYTLQLLNSTFFVRTGDRYRYLAPVVASSSSSPSCCATRAAHGRSVEVGYAAVHRHLRDDVSAPCRNADWQTSPSNWIAGNGRRAGAGQLHGDVVAPPSTGDGAAPPKAAAPEPERDRAVPRGDGHRPLRADRREHRCIDDVFRTDANSVVRAMIQRVASCWRKDVTDPALSETLEKVVDADVALGEEDGRRATIQHLGSPIDAERAAFAFRRAMIQGDSLWTAAIGGMLGLAISRHTSSFTYIYNMAARAKHPEIRNAYRAVQSFTGLPDLPPL